MRLHIILIICLLLYNAVAAQAQNIYGKGNPVPQADILPEGTVRAMIIKNESQLPGGPRAEGVAGDFKLYNHRAAYVIAGVRPASGINPFGGVVEDAGLLVNDGRGASWYNLMGDSYFVFARAGDDPLMNGRLFAPVKAEVLKDGSDGEAIVRVTGRDTEFPMRREQYGLSSKPLNIRIIIDYILGADSPVLETRIRIMKQKGAMDVAMGMVFLLGDGADVMAPGAGYDIPAATGTSVPLLGATSDAVSYGWFTPAGNIKIHSMFDNMIITEIGAVTASVNGEDSFSMHLATGCGDMASVFEQKYKIEDWRDIGTISGTCVSNLDGTPVPGAVAHIFSSDQKYLSNAACGPGGAFQIRLPEGDYILRAGLFGPSGAKASNVTVRREDETTVALNVEAPASLEFEVTDQNGTRIPATISLKALDEAEVDPSTKYFRDKHKRDGLFTHFSGTGKGTIQAPPGTYDVYFSRGLEYEYVKKSLELKSGESISEKIMLEHVVDTTGYLCGDFHIHAAPSFDSDDTLQDKLLGIAAAGLEVPVATDHNMYTDYEPIIEELGLQRVMKSIVGTELTTTKIGHFNAYPLTYMPLKPNRGAFDWIDMTPGEIFSALRDDPAENSVVQVNHPLGAGGGYLTSMGYNAATAKAGHAKFSRDFDAMEILNGGSYQELEHTLAWWFSFLNRGFLVTGVGNSDSHGVFSLEVGYPRNYVKTGTDIPGDLNIASFIEDVHKQHVTVSGGPFVLIDANGQGGMGHVITDTDGGTDLRVSIQAPSWMSIHTLKIYSTSGIVETIHVTETKTPERYNGTITVNPRSDTWYIAVAEGDGDLFPVYPGKRPFSFTNPVYIDVDGNGLYDPPMKWNETTTSENDD